ncbi:SDR family oxidoreductase [Pigmentiphaga soli]|uniref:SDR family oxidoreductase n=1 Tax=Pigmentiphaga soli TaxID=1007095 RepID=A0ABP8HAB6_9BURK
MLKGKTAIVTGSVGGIGFATAEMLASNGCAVMLNGFAAPDVAAAKADYLAGRYGVRVQYHGADLRDVDQIEELVLATTERLGPVDILVNNAAVRHFKPTEALGRAAWDESIAVNITAPFHLCRLALPMMRAADWGRIVNMASVLGFFAQPDRIEYVTTKTALLGLTRSIAVDVARTGITCNAICPGTVHTESIEARIRRQMAESGLSYDEAFARFMESRAAAGRLVSENSVTSMIELLCGPAGKDINGSALTIDVGYSAGR